MTAKAVIKRPYFGTLHLSSRLVAFWELGHGVMDKSMIRRNDWRAEVTHLIGDTSVTAVKTFLNNKRPRKSSGLELRS